MHSHSGFRLAGYGRLVAAGVAIVFAAYVSGSASGQTNTFPTTGNAGIGTTTPITPLQLGTPITNGYFPPSTNTPDQLFINDAPTLTSGLPTAVQVTMQPAASSSANFNALKLNVNVPSTSSVSVGNLEGFYDVVDFNGTGSMNHGYAGYGSFNYNSASALPAATGIYGNVRNISTGTITTATATSWNVENSSTGNVTSASDGVFGTQNTGGGTIGTQYGVYSSVNNAGSTITNSYGVYITGYGTAGTWTNTPYDIYAADTGALNYFAGNVGIGVTNPVSKLAVNGKISASEVVVTSSPADYVFGSDYRLAPLGEVAEYIAANHHPPEIPSGAEVESKGVALGEMQSKLLAKIEELTLHMIQAEERSDRLERENLRLVQDNVEIRSKIAHLAASRKD
jgi:hypothetical protein